MSRTIESGATSEVSMKCSECGRDFAPDDEEEICPECQVEELFGPYGPFPMDDEE